MFGKGCKSSVSRIETVIGENTAIDGAVTFSGGLHIDGRIKGDVTAEAGKEAMLTVSEQGSVEGNIKVPNLVLNGRVTGDVHVTDRLEMAVTERPRGVLL